MDGSWYGINDFCVFADGSAIDTWTLEYHAAQNDKGNNITLKGLTQGSALQSRHGVYYRHNNVACTVGVLYM